MSNKSRAILNLFLNIIGAIVGGAMTAVSAGDGVEAFKKPFVILTIMATVLPVIRATVNDNPKGGAEQDRKELLASGVFPKP